MKSIEGRECSLTNQFYGLKQKTILVFIGFFIR